MINVKSKKIAIVILSILCLCIVALGIFVIESKAEEVEFSQPNYRAEYNLNEVFTVDNVKINYKGQEYDTDAVVCFPDGKTISKTQVELTQSGEYKVKYFAVINGITLSKEITFIVRESIFNFVGNGDYEYGTNSYLGDDVYGLNVSLSPGAILHFNKVIDISNNTKLDEIIRLYCTPAERGVKEVDKFEIILTDIYDENNYVKVQYRWSPDRTYYTYINAAASGQSYMALKYSKDKGDVNALEIDGSVYNDLWKDNRYFGYGARTSMDGSELTEGVVEPYINNCHQLSLDYKERRVYVQRPTGITGNRLVMDLDEKLFLGDNIWNGFTTGEVKLSISATASTASPFNFFITKLQGHDISQNIKNEFAPTIEVDFEEQLQPVKAIVGKPFKIFEATFNDDSGKLADSNVYVYYNYNNSSKINVNIEDGCFTPQELGAYTIVYTATDTFGNNTSCLVDVMAIEDEGVDLVFGAKETEFILGNSVQVADFEVTSSLETYNVSITAKKNQSDLTYAIANDELEFFPLEYGVYTIEYFYQDYVQSKTFSYEIEIKNNNSPIFISEPKLPRYFIKDCTYSLEEVFGYDYSDAGNKIAASIFVKEDDGQLNPLSNGKYTVLASDKIQVVYKLIGKANTVEKTYFIPVVDVGYGEIGNIDLSKYLQSKDFSSISNEDSIVYTTDKVAESSLSLINSAYIKIFNAQFSLLRGNSFKELSIVLTDVKNSKNQVSVTFEKSVSGKTDIKVSRKGLEVIGQMDDMFGGTEVKVSVSNENFVIDKSDVKIPTEKLFNGFSSYVYVDFNFYNGNGDSSIQFKQLMNQMMSSNKYDAVGPVVYFDSFKFEYFLGDVVEISNFEVYDFVDPSVEFSCKFYDNNACVIADDGTVLDGSQDYTKKYSILCSSYFNLTLSGRAYDKFGNPSKKIVQAINVIDVTSPLITLENIFYEGKVETEIKLAKCNALDDKDGTDVTISVAIIDPKGVITLCKNIEAFTPKIKGVHKVIYYVFDKTGNSEFIEYSVNVK